MLGLWNDFRFQLHVLSVLRAWLNMLGPKGWMQPFLDIFKFQYFGPDQATQARLRAQLNDEPRVEYASSFALPITFEFLIAHELGHLYLDHFKKSATTTIQVPGS